MPRVDRGERGETLIEITVTVAILGIAIVAVVAGLATAIVASDSHRKLASADTMVRSVAEAVKDRSVAWNANGDYSAAISGIVTAGYTHSVQAQCWTGNNGAPTWANCPNGDLGLQRITITVTSTGARGESESVTIIKRRT